MLQRFESTAETLASRIGALKSERDNLKDLVGAKEMGLGFLNNQFKEMTKILNENKNTIENSKRVRQSHEMRLENQKKEIKDLMKSLDENKSVIAGHNKIIKQQKQRIGKADKQSTKNHVF